eukprot:TRINITY_DN13956_c0_g1_i1.p1 TRINITY_DN13956_c0_g1~~TRINITY_DN13956_c0_g1_i1.p1  ORF type:complete len:534 (-),score=68.11 TRINITY_DN13956_c0_g1_i1:4-1575(-)
MPEVPDSFPLHVADALRFLQRNLHQLATFAPQMRFLTTSEMGTASLRMQQLSTTLHETFADLVEQLTVTFPSETVQPEVRSVSPPAARPLVSGFSRKVVVSIPSASALPAQGDTLKGAHAPSTTDPSKLPEFVSSPRPTARNLEATAYESLYCYLCGITDALRADAAALFLPPKTGSVSLRCVSCLAPAADVHPIANSVIETKLLANIRLSRGLVRSVLCAPFSTQAGTGALVVWKRKIDSSLFTRNEEALLLHCASVSSALLAYFSRDLKLGDFTEQPILLPKSPPQDSAVQLEKPAVVFRSCNARPDEVEAAIKQGQLCADGSLYMSREEMRNQLAPVEFGHTLRELHELADSLQRQSAETRKMWLASQNEVDTWRARCDTARKDIEALKQALAGVNAPAKTLPDTTQTPPDVRSASRASDDEISLSEFLSHKYLGPEPASVAALERWRPFAHLASDDANQRPHPPTKGQRGKRPPVIPYSPAKPASSVLFTPKQFRASQIPTPNVIRWNGRAKPLITSEF